MAKNFFKNIFNQTKNTISKKKSLVDSQKLSDIIIINNNESNYFQQKTDKYNLLLDYYPTKEKKNKKGKNFLNKIHELSNNFQISQDKFNLAKSSLEKLNEDLFSNLIKQIDCYIEEIQRLNKKLISLNNDNKKEIIQQLNDKILENEKKIRNYENKIRDNAVKEEKLSKEVEYYKKRVIFYKNKININLISRKISNENRDINKGINYKNDNGISNLKSNKNIIKNPFPRQRHSRASQYFNQSSGKIIQLRAERKILSSIDFPNMTSNVREKILLKTKDTNTGKENNISEFEIDKDKKNDDSNKNLNKVNKTTDNADLDFSGDSIDNIKYNDEDYDLCENLNINENMKKLFSQQIDKKESDDYFKHKKINSFIINNDSDIKEKNFVRNFNKIDEYKNKNNNFIRRKSKGRYLTIKNGNNNIRDNQKSFNSSFQKSKNENKNKLNKSQILTRMKTSNDLLNNQKDKQNLNQVEAFKTEKNNNNSKNKKFPLIETRGKSKGKELKKSKSKGKEKNISNNDKIANNKNIKFKKVNTTVIKNKIETKKDKKDSIDENKNKSEKKNIEMDEKELKKILKDINEDYNNDIDMLNNQENQIKFLLNLIDVND